MRTRSARLSKRPKAGPSAPPAPVYAAVDLGSNSFHLMVARYEGGAIQVVDRLRERVALAAALDDDKRLSPDAIGRAVAVLRRFGERLRALPTAQVRAVGTNTLRQARNRRDFLVAGEAALGHPIEVIAGREEARLIYLGVERSLEEPLQRRLVVDIGGGSTECIVGDGAQILAADSLFMGCVSYSERYFRDGGLSEAAMRAATTAAALELQSLASRYERLGFDDAVGSSGTITVIEDILRAQGLSSSGVTARGLKKLRKQVQSAGHVSRLQLPGMPNERAPVLPGGIAILSALFEVFALERMQVATAALREGLVHDLAGPEGGQAVRERSIAQLAERHGVDQEQAEAVAETALGLLTQVPDEWLSGVPDAAPWLRWAALVHEVGQSLRYSGYHRHGEYILRHSDLAGFSRQTQRALALMVRSHRRKLDVERFADGVLETQRKGLLRLCLLLRLAVRLCRNRGPALAQAPELTVKKKQLALTFAPGWLADHPLTEAGLEEEATQIAAVGYTLTAR